MDLSVLLPDPAEVEEMRSELYYVRTVLSNAVDDYAGRALKSADKILDTAREGGVIVSTFQDQRDYQLNKMRCSNAIKALHMINYGLINLEAVPDDPEAQEQNELFKFDSLELEKVAAMLEGAERRMEMAAMAFPANARPMMRLDPQAFTPPQKPPQAPQRGQDDA